MALQPRSLKCAIASMSDHEVLSPEKEAQILDGAALVFAEAGYEGASMARIAAVAGVSKGTLYNYFAGKRDLFAAFMQRICDARIKLIFDELDAQQRPEQALLCICRRMLDMLTSEQGLLVYRMVVAEAGKFPELAEVFYAAGPRRALVRMTEWVRQNAAACRLDIDDPEFAAEQLFALMQTRVLMRRRLHMDGATTDADLERVVAAGVSLFLRGYGSEKTVLKH
jgi:AcrR family transcriptional regulator